MRRKVLLLFPCVTLVLWLGQMFGCTARNEVLPTLDPPVIVDLDRPGVPLRGLDRSDWPAHEFLVAVRRVEHAPTWTSSPALVDTTARSRGEYPTAESALELPPPTDRVKQAVLTPYAFAVVAVETIIAPVRIFLEPAFATHLSPLLEYERRPDLGP